jgi:hypothetical protein
LREVLPSLFGALKAERVSASALCVALKRQFGDQLLSQHLQHALNRLEELNGGISLGDFQTLVGRVSIVNMMEEYQYLPSYSMATQSDPQLPLLVWVDDLPTNNTNEVSLALSVGVKVIQHTSTAAAIAWIEENQGAMRCHSPLVFDLAFNILSRVPEEERQR